MYRSVEGCTSDRSLHRHYLRQADQTLTSIAPPIHNSGIVLKDLVAIDAQGKDFSNSTAQTLNMPKFRLLWNILSAIRQCQATPPLFPTDLDKMRILRVRDTEGGEKFKERRKGDGRRKGEEGGMDERREGRGDGGHEVSTF